jgi:hypothetical protein
MPQPLYGGGLKIKVNAAKLALRVNRDTEKSIIF